MIEQRQALETRGLSIEKKKLGFQGEQKSPFLSVGLQESGEEDGEQTELPLLGQLEV